MERISNALRLLGDDTRLRLLNLIAETPLNVSELTGILGLAQSGISRHLSHLKKAGLLTERKEGVWTFYGLVEDRELDADLRLLLGYLKEQLAQLGDANVKADRARLSEVLRQRGESGPGLNERLLEPGQSWLSWSRALTWLVGLASPLDVADLGCGDGTLTIEMARFARRVVGVDRNPQTLEPARQRVLRAHLDNVELREGRLEALDLPDASFDLAFFSQSLHHMPEPQKGLSEAFRILRPGGRLVALELASHSEEWVREKLAHHWLGFEQDDLAEMVESAGFSEVKLEQHHQGRGAGFRVIQATGIKK